MKRALGLLLFLSALLLLSAALADVEISEAVFPDAGFRQYILDAGLDGNGDGRLSRAEIRKVTSIDCHSRKIKSLQGIETFTELVELQCYDNRLTEVDVSKNRKLASLGAYRNRLTKLDLSACKNLVSFSCSGNPVSELLLPNTRKLTWVDLTRTDLRELEIGRYPLLVKLVRAGEPTRYIYADTEEQVNWVSDTSFLAVDRQLTLKEKGAVLYAGTSSAAAAAEIAETAETTEAPAENAGKRDETETAAESTETGKPAEAPAESAEKRDRTEAAAETGGKQQIARLFSNDRIYTPEFDGSYKTIWTLVPEDFSIKDNDAPVPDELAGYFARVNLEGKKGKNIRFSIYPLGSSERWMGYRNLNEVPEDQVEDVKAFYVSHFHDTGTGEPSEVEVYTLPGGLKILRVLNDFETINYNVFKGWTMHNGYELSISFHISAKTGFRSPTDEELQILEGILSNLEEIPD